MEKKLTELKKGDNAIVKRIATLDPKIKRRLLDMGVTNGASVVMVKRAPFGDPIEITLRGYELTLRKIEADSVTIEVK